MLKNSIKRSLSIFLTVAMICGFMINISPTVEATPIPSIVPIYRDYENYTFAERAADMVARMTLAQKTQNMVSSLTTATPVGDDAEGTLSTGIKQYGWWNESLHGYSSVSMTDNTNAGGVQNATSYAQPLSMGQTWDPDLIYRVGTEIGDEIREMSPGLDLNLNFYSPTVNLSRDPRWGRNAESYGEDPVHSSIMASQFINGVQGFTKEGKLIDEKGYWKANLTMKHYFANNSENNRLMGVSNLTEQESREYYTRVYREVLRRSKPASVMSSYNRIQVAHTAYSPFLEMPGGINNYSLDTMLRQTFGFDGYVTGDCNSSNVAGFGGSGVKNTGPFEGDTEGGYNYVAHGWRAPEYTWYKGDTISAMTGSLSYPQTAAWAVMGGAELECNQGVASGKTYKDFNPLTDENYKNAVPTPSGVYTESAVDVAVAELLEARLRVGEWDDKENYLDGPSGVSKNRVRWFDEAKARLDSYSLAIPTASNGRVATTEAKTMTEERLKLVGELSGKSLVLLKNEVKAGVNGENPLLPVNFPTEGNFSVGVYGSQRASVTLGGYSSSRSAAGQAKQVNPVNGIRIALQGKFGERITVTDRGASFVADSDSADEYVIAVVGGVSASEQRDRADFALATADITLIKNLYKANKKLIVVMLTTCQIGEVTTEANVDNMFESIPALLFSSYLGDRVGTGVGDVIAGNVTPSARTNATWYPKSTPYGRFNNEVDGTITYGSLNQIRSYRLSPGTDGDWQSPFGSSVAPDQPYSFTGPNLGRTYMYYTGKDDNAIRFPMGFGLSYTKFSYSEPEVYINGALQSGAAAIRVEPNDKIEYKFKVTNTGSFKGADVAQFYVKTPADIVALNDPSPKGQAYAFKRLKDFKKTRELDPGEYEIITLSVEVPDIAFWSNEGRKFELVQKNDNYLLQIGRSSADILYYGDQNCGEILSHEMRINNTNNWDPKVSVVSFKPNTPEDAVNNIPQRLIFKEGDTVRPNATVSMANDILYGYINRMYSSPEESMYPIPDNITFKYEANRPGVVDIKEDGTITALKAGVVTITGTATDSKTNSKASSEFVVYVQGEPEDLGYDAKMKEFKFGGETFTTIDGVYAYDVNVPKNVSVIDFTPTDITPNYPDDVKVSVTFSPANGAVREGAPCVATVKITGTSDLPIVKTYTINFGHMSATWLRGYNYMGYNTSVDIRFSDGETELKLSQAFYDDDGKMQICNAKDFPPIPKHGGDTLKIFSSVMTNEEVRSFNIKEFLWNHDFVPIIQEQITKAGPVNVWKPAKIIEPGKQYIVVSGGMAMSNTNVPSVQGSNPARRGLAAKAIDIDEKYDYIDPSEVTPDMIWKFTDLTDNHVSPGQYTRANGWTGFYLTNDSPVGDIVESGSYPVQRSTETTASVQISTYVTVGSANRPHAIWFLAPFDRKTGETTLFTYTTSSGGLIYTLHKAQNGFVAEGGTGSFADYQVDSRIKLYEYVEDEYTEN